MIDNLRMYKGQEVCELMETCGCQELFMPVYSPIEEACSKLKAALRRVGARTHEALPEAVAALLTVAAADASGRFQHCGTLILLRFSGSTFLGTTIAVLC